MNLKTSEIVLIGCTILTVIVAIWVPLSIAGREGSGSIEVHEDVTIPLLSEPNLLPDIQVMFRRHPMAGAAVTDVTITNTGATAISAEDFSVPITFTPGDGEKIYGIALPNSEKDQLAFIPNPDGSFSLKPLLLNSGDSCQFGIIFDNAPNPLPPSIFKWNMKIKNVTHIALLNSDVQKVLGPKSVLDGLNDYFPHVLALYVYHNPAEVWLMFLVFIVLEFITLWLLIKAELLKFPTTAGGVIFVLLQFGVFCNADNIACLFHTGTERNAPIAYVVLSLNFAILMYLLFYILIRRKPPGPGN